MLRCIRLSVDGAITALKTFMGVESYEPITVLSQ